MISKVTFRLSTLNCLAQHTISLNVLPKLQFKLVAEKPHSASKRKLMLIFKSNHIPKATLPSKRKKKKLKIKFKVGIICTQQCGGH